jgi:hypothetical protein
MNPKQTFNFFGDYSVVFIKLVFAFLAIYALYLILNLLRDKFINDSSVHKRDNVSDLLNILHRLFIYSGAGFIFANIVDLIIVGVGRNLFNSSAMSVNENTYITFGIILIFIGVGFKVAKAKISKE